MMSVTMISKNSALRIFHLKKWETEDIFKNEKNLFYDNVSVVYSLKNGRTSFVRF